MAESIDKKSWTKKSKNSSLLRYIFGIPVALALLFYIVSYLIDEPLRRITEEKINRNLIGYSVRLPKLHFQLLDLSVTMEGLTLRQDAHPDPAILSLPMVKTTVHWREILAGKLVAEVMVEQPKININLQQLRSEAAGTIPIKERGWQQAMEEIYPLKINTMTINDASVTYSDQDPKRPLVLSHLNLQAKNIRNIRQPDQVYPSSFRLDTAIFGTGHGSVDGVANFLAEPLPGIKARFKLENLPIDFFKPVIARANLSIKDGVLRASGNIEYAPTVKIATIKSRRLPSIRRRI